MRKLLLFALLLISGCTDVYNNASNSKSTSPTAPTVTKYKVEFRVTGQNLNGNVSVRQSDSINGLSVYNGSVPYVNSFDTDADSIFLTIDGSANGTSSTSVLQVQIFVNGQLFKEGFSQGFALQSTASGTYRK